MGDLQFLVWDIEHEEIKHLWEYDDPVSVLDGTYHYLVPLYGVTLEGERDKKTFFTGDIVERYDIAEYDENCYCNIKGIVEFKSGKFVVEDIDSANQIDLCELDIDSVGILGNKYQNPELL